MNDFQKEITISLLEKKVRQYQLAEELGVSVTLLNEIIRDKRNLKIDFAFRLEKLGYLKSAKASLVSIVLYKIEEYKKSLV